MTSPLAFLLLSCWIWVVTWFLTEADGPYDIFKRMRRAFGVEKAAASSCGPASGGLVGQLLSCFACTSVWVSGSTMVVLLFMGLPLWEHTSVTIQIAANLAIALAAVAVAILIQRVGKACVEWQRFNALQVELLKLEIEAQRRAMKELE